MGVTDVTLGRLGKYCRGRRLDMLDAVHALSPGRSEVVVKLGARRAPNVTQFCEHITLAL
jgi:hypothetical protein